MYRAGTKTSQFFMTLEEISVATVWSKMSVRRPEKSAMEKLLAFFVYNQRIESDRSMDDQP